MAWLCRCFYDDVMTRKYHCASDYLQNGCLFNRGFIQTTKKTLKIHISDPLWGINSPVFGGFISPRPIMRMAFSCHDAMMSFHYNDVIMCAIASPITSLTIVYSTVYSDADQRKLYSPASQALVRGIPRGPLNSPHKWPVTRKMFPFDDVIMWPFMVSTANLLMMKTNTVLMTFVVVLWNW